MAWTTYRDEGGLLPADVLEQVVAGEFGGQDPAAFGATARGFSEDVNRAWTEARAHWTSFGLARERLASDESTTSVTREVWLVPFLRVLGFRLLYQSQAARTDDGLTYAISHRVESGDGLPVHLVGIGYPLVKRQPGQMRLSPYATVQEYLNKTEHLWGLVANGAELWILRDSSRVSRPTYLAWDLETMMTAGKYDDFLALYRLCHVSRFPRTVDDGPSSWIERYVGQAEAQGGRIREDLRDGVEQALITLGNGFLTHPANERLREHVRTGRMDATQFHQRLLRLIYRLLFLLVAEERQMLLPADDPRTRAIYEAAYSVEHLRRLAGGPPGQVAGPAGDLWVRLVETFELFVYHPEDSPILPIPPLNGELFGTEALSELRGLQLDNASFVRALRPLTWMTAPHGGLRRIDYAGLDVEELGGIYESLLELGPAFDTTAATPEFLFLVGTDRKATGSYYTRPALVQQLITSVVDPVIADRVRQAPPADRARALLALTICDPACGSGHFLLAAARRVARALAQVWSGEAEPAAEDYQRALHQVIEHCVYGVDKNPLAVDLCKVALWIEGHHVGKPLTFLDHRIRCGDSLVGVFDLGTLSDGVPSAAYVAKTGDVKAVVQRVKRLNAAELQGQLRWAEILDAVTEPANNPRSLAAAYAAMDAIPADDPGGVQAKEAAYQQYRSPDSPWHAAWTAADVWTAAFLAPLTEAAERAVPSTRHVRAALEGRGVPAAVEALATEVVARAQGFHWPLEFPDVWARGGFDIVLGNPPWERIKLQEEEFFRTRAPAIAQAANKAERGRRIAALETEQPALWDAFRGARQTAEAVGVFARASGRFPLGAVGDINTFALFAELGRALVRSHGLMGMVLPTGIATDYTYRDLFGDLVDREQLVSLFDFENREGLFPAVDSRYKFSLLTLSHQPVTHARFAFFLTQVDQLHDRQRTFTLTPADLARVNPNTRTVPVFRTRQDAALTQKIYERVPVLVNDRTGENPWGITFVRMFDMANDSGLFHTRPDDGLLPLYEAKLFHQYDHRWATFDGYQVRDVRLDEKIDPTFAATPRYWVRADDVRARTPDDWSQSWFLGYRRITRATDERTTIASVIPRVGAGDVLALMYSTVPPQLLLVLLGNLNALCLDYVARQKVGSVHLDFFLMKQLPVLPPNAYSSQDLAFLEPRLFELVYSAYDLAGFARDLGHDGPPYAWDLERRCRLRAELDGYYAHLYGLTRDELRYIVDPQDVMGPEFPGETFRALKAHEVAAYGEYRTARLVLEAYDDLAPGFAGRAGQPTAG